MMTAMKIQKKKSEPKFLCISMFNPSITSAEHGNIHYIAKPEMYINIDIFRSFHKCHKYIRFSPLDSRFMS